tara:strand:+ start:757 stop:1074 length:318 start_codon:yes stop_codon:yes gene_type:complete
MKKRKKSEDQKDYERDVDWQINKHIDRGQMTPQERRLVSAHMTDDARHRREVVRLAGKHSRSIHAQEFYGRDTPKKMHDTPETKGVDRDSKNYSKRLRGKVRSKK